MKGIIPKILGALTGKKRYDRKMPWYKDSWTGNAFRFLERITWKELGKIEFQAAKYYHVDAEGKVCDRYEFYTFEAAIIHSEYLLRAYLKGVIAKAKVQIHKIRNLQIPDFTGVFMPQFAFSGASFVPNMNDPEGYAFAVNVFTSTYDTDQGSATTAFVNNGDFLYVATNGTGSGSTAATYAGAAMTQIGTSYNHTSTSRFHTTWGKTTPAPGNNNVVVTGSANWQFVMFCANGVSQSSPTSGLTTGSETTAANPTIAVTTTVNNAVVIASGQVLGSTPTAGANTSLIIEGVGASFFIFRSTSPVAVAGAFTINITAGSGSYMLRGFGLNPETANVVVDSVATGRSTSSSTLTYAHTNVAGDVMVIGASAFGNGLSVSSVTYNGVAASRVGGVYQNNFNLSDIWSLPNPSVGTYNIVITLNASASVIVGGSVAFANSGGGVSGIQTASGTNSLTDSKSLTITSAAGFMTFDNIAVQFNASVVVPGTDQTQRWNEATSRVGAGSTKVASASTSMSWTQSGGTGDGWAYAGVSVGVLVSNINVSDSVTITESVSRTLISNINVNDSITVAETVFREMNSFISVFDTITITESTIADAAIIHYIMVSDSVAVTDSVAVESVLNLMISDSVTITESVSIFVPDQVTGIARMRSLQNEYPFAMDDDTII